MMIKHYAQIKNGRVENAIVCDDSFIETYRSLDDAKRFDAIVEMTSGAQIGWSYSNGVFTSPVPVDMTPPQDSTNNQTVDHTVISDGGDS